jgi:hypothetical protein
VNSISNTIPKIKILNYESSWGFFFALNFQEQFPPYATSYLVSNPFSSRWQELPLVALPPPEKSGFQPA